MDFDHAGSRESIYQNLPIFTQAPGVQFLHFLQNFYNNGFEQNLSFLLKNDSIFLCFFNSRLTIYLLPAQVVLPFQFYQNDC